MGGTAASFANPRGIAVSTDGLSLYVTTYGHRIRKVTIASGKTTTIAGTGADKPFANGPGATATFSYPDGIVASADGTSLFVADSHNHRIRQVKLALPPVSPPSLPPPLPSPPPPSPLPPSPSPPPPSPSPPPPVDAASTMGDPVTTYNGTSTRFYMQEGKLTP